MYVSSTNNNPLYKYGNIIVRRPYLYLLNGREHIGRSSIIKRELSFTYSNKCNITMIIKIHCKFYINFMATLQVTDFLYIYTWSQKSFKSNAYGYDTVRHVGNLYSFSYIINGCGKYCIIVRRFLYSKKNNYMVDLASYTILRSFDKDLQSFPFIKYPFYLRRPIEKYFT